MSPAALLTQVRHKYSGSSVGGSELGAGRAGLTQLSSREGFLLSVLSFPFREMGFPVLFRDRAREGAHERGFVVLLLL